MLMALKQLIFGSTILEVDELVKLVLECMLTQNTLVHLAAFIREGWSDLSLVPCAGLKIFLALE
jgi:hypothetical protein